MGGICWMDYPADPRIHFVKKVSGYVSKIFDSFSATDTAFYIRAVLCLEKTLRIAFNQYCQSVFAVQLRQSIYLFVFQRNNERNFVLCNHMPLHKFSRLYSGIKDGRAHLLCLLFEISSISLQYTQHTVRLIFQLHPRRLILNMFMFFCFLF